MDTFTSPARSWLRRLALLPALMLWFASAALAQDSDPPGRVAALTQQVGSVVFAPDGEDEWVDLPLNRPLTRGDRVWTDRGARAELHMGATTLHLDSQSHLAFFELDDESAQLSLTQGTLNMRVRDLMPRENAEIDTPNLAVRAVRVGDYRVDVDPDDGTTRVIVRSGEAIVYGQGGESLRLHAGQQATFEGRELRQVRGRVAATDDFDQWAADLNRREDQSVSARYVPRQVIGYQELDQYGTWDTHQSYGPVWYPRITVNDWAPYRYGRWTYIRPWGWTWVDEAPWGFAPFHYGRWAMIGSRWAWVPGHFGPRPIYAPALVAFVGGGSGVSFSFSIGSSPGIGWYPLAPGEAWWPTYRTTNVYLTNINRNIVINRDVRYVHVHRHRADAWTSVRVEDFNRGRRVRDHWRPVRPNDFDNARITTQLPRPDREDRGGRDRGTARLVAPPPAVSPGVTSRTFPGLATNREDRREAREERREDRRDDRRDAREDRRDDRRDAREDRRDARDDRRDERAIRGEEPRRPPNRDDARAEEARREHQERLREQQQQRDQAARQQQERAQREQERVQREQAAARQQQERAQREQERAQREQERAQREQAVRKQQERVQREQARAEREQAMRQQQEQQRAQREAERAQREQQRQQQQEQRAQRQQQRTQEAGAAPTPRRERPQRDNNDEDERKGRGRGG